MASSLRNAAKNRQAKMGSGGRVASATRTANKAVRGGNGGANAGFSFKGAGRSAAYRGGASKTLRGGGGALNAHRAGMKAQQAYGG